MSTGFTQPNFSATSANPQDPNFNDEHQQRFFNRPQSGSRDFSHGVLEDREWQAICIALSVGVGVGFLLSSLWSQPESHSRWFDRAAAEGVGRRMLEKIDRMLPDAISEKLGR